MADPALALQAAIVAVLKGATEAGEAVYDAVPNGAPFPRIVLGPGQSLGNYADCYDGSESFWQVDAYDRPDPDGTGLGFGRVKRIASQIRDLLNGEGLVLAGHVLELNQVESAVYSVEPDGITRRARLSARFLTQPSD